MRASNASYEDIQFDEMDVSMSLHKGHLNVLANAVSQATNTSITSQLSCRPFESEPNPTLTASLTEVPFEWAQPWIDSTFVQLEGRLRADLSLEGDWDQPWIQGEGRVDSLKAYVPNLGTHFGGHGNFQMGQGDLWLNNFPSTMPSGTWRAWKVPWFTTNLKIGALTRPLWRRLNHCC